MFLLCCLHWRINVFIFHNDERKRKVIQNPYPGPDYRQKLITSRGSLLAHAMFGRRPSLIDRQMIWLLKWVTGTSGTTCQCQNTSDDSVCFSENMDVTLSAWSTASSCADCEELTSEVSNSIVTVTSHQFFVSAASLKMTPKCRSSSVANPTRHRSSVTSPSLSPTVRRAAQHETVTSASSVSGCCCMSHASERRALGVAGHVTGGRAQ